MSPLALVAIHVAGPDARGFLQGQLSNDVRKLAPDQALLATCNSARGRVQGVLTLVEAGGAVIVLVPLTMAERLAARLRSYVLRARVNVAEPPDTLVAPLTATDAATLCDALPLAPGSCARRGEVIVLRWWSADERWLLIQPRTSAPNLRAAWAGPDWHRADIAAGLPQIHPQTYETFIAQTLNLDVLGAISYEKGCYTGQEIIARTHFRSVIRRRMRRFAAECAAPPPGTRVLHAGSHVGDVVDACRAPDGGCELLAVVSHEHAAADLRLDDAAGSVLNALPLPYAIPASGPARGVA